jgi:hypothetical protein
MIFQNAPDIRRFYERNVSTVPAREDKAAEEEWTLAVYLWALARHGLLTYPLICENREAPDFVLRWNTAQTTGLEVTRVIGKVGKQIYREQARSKLPAFAPKDLDLQQRGSHARIDTLYREMSQAFDRKVRKVRRYGTTADHCDLVIYVASSDVIPFPGEHDTAIERLAAVISCDQEASPGFSRVSAIMWKEGWTVWYDICGQRRPLKCDPPDLP